MVSLIFKNEMINQQQIKYQLFFVLMIAVVFASCVKRPVYNEFKMIHPGGWHSDSVRVFTVLAEDTTSLHDLSVSVRHTAAYPYLNLWLFVEQLSPDSLIARDTVLCTLADYTGMWLGTGTGSVYLLTVPFKNGFRFSKQGEYQFSIVHGMRDEVLKGVHAIGLKLANQHGKK
jgi:gliding motility-associated lipoprotein GldH